MRQFVACMPLRHHVETLLLFDPNHSPAAANVWISHPTAGEEQALGKLVVLTAIGGRDRTNLDVISLIQQELVSGYYQTTDLKPERAFEHALQQTNRRLHQVITDGVGQWLTSANMFVAALWRDQLVFSSVGAIHAYLLRHGRITSIAEIDETSKVNPVRVFSHVTSGQLQERDRLLLCTTSLLDYFSLEKLRRTLVDHPPAEAIHQWEATLLGVEQRSSFAAVVVDVTATETTVAQASRPVIQSTVGQSAPQVSMEQLIAQEQATERLLTPSIWPAIRDILNQISGATSRFVRRVIFRQPIRRVVPPGSIGLPSALAPTEPGLIRRVAHSIGHVLARGWTVIRGWRPKPTSRPEPAPQMTMAPVLRRRWRFSLNAAVRWFQRLGARRQLLFVASIILVFVIAYTSLPRTNPSVTDTVAATPETIREHLGKAEAALLYGGEETAQQQVSEAQALVDRLPNRSSKEKSTRQALQTEVDAVLLKLAHQTTIPEPAVVAQLATVADGIQPQQLYLVGTRLLAVDPDRSLYVSLTPAKNDATLLPASSLDIGRALTGTTSGTSSALFITDRQGFIELNLTTRAWKPVDSAWPTQTPRIQSLATYQGRIYALDTADNDIIRFSRSTNSLGRGVPWLKETTNLGLARGLAVDGTIFVLQPDGVVENYVSNRKSSFRLSAMTPPLRDATRIWTDVESKHLYLVDPSNRRVVVFNKDGQLVDQYTSPAWNGIQDVVIDEQTKTAYVLAGTTVTTFTLLH